MTVEWGSLSFAEAIDYLRQKVNLPTERWTDLREGQHARAFTIAGATRDELLADFRATVERVVRGELTLEDFRKEFDRIVAAHGWTYKGGRGWRSKVIYETNLNTAYQAGRYKQMTDPDVLAVRPFWQYDHSDWVRHPRLQHKAWDGMVLHWDDPFWDTHYPPNGWGCQCRIQPLSARELAALGKDGPDPSPPVKEVAHRLRTSSGDVTVRVPEGLDPGWAYNVGEAAWGRPEHAKRIVDGNESVWEPLPTWGQVDVDPATLPRVPADLPVARLGPTAREGDEIALRGNLRAAIGGDEAVFVDPTGTHIRLTQAIADHVLEAPKRWTGRDAWWPFMPETIADPAEVWVEFSRNRETGRIGLVRRYVKLVTVGKDKSIPVIVHAEGGFWIGVTAFFGKADYLAKLRRGRLVWRRGDLRTRAAGPVAVG
ncbi:MAG: hypothetical protein RLY86_688 [Pseudomonadota bacterium]